MRRTMGLLLVSVCLFGACAGSSSDGDLEALRGEVADLRTELERATSQLSTTSTTTTIISDALASGVDSWMIGCQAGYRSGRDDALMGSLFDPVYPDFSSEETDGFLWGYEAGWMEGKDALNDTRGNHPIDWCLEQNRPSQATAQADTTVSEKDSVAEFIEGFDDGFVLGFGDGLDGEWSNPLEAVPPEMSERYSEGYQSGYTAAYFEGQELVSNVEAPSATPASPPPTTQAPAPPSGPSAEFCFLFQLQLEMAGEARARSICNPTSFGECEPMYYGMNYGHYKAWVADPLEEAGCPRPPGY